MLTNTLEKTKPKKKRSPRFNEPKTSRYELLITPSAKANLGAIIEQQTGKKMSIGDVLERLARGELVLSQVCH